MAPTSHRAPPAQDMEAAARHADHAPAQADPCCHGQGHAPPAAAAHQAPSLPTAPGTHWPWGEAAANTAFCLLGCSLGDIAVVLASRLWFTSAGMASVMLLATVAGLVSSLLLETLWLFAHGHPIARALRMAIGMSLLSMLAMETAMNLVDLGLTGGQRMHLPALEYLGVLACGEIAGFLVPWPFNSWRLSHGRACH